MSYDFHLFRPIVGEAPLITAQSVHEKELTLDPNKDQVKRKVAEVLRAANRSLVEFEIDHEIIASTQKIPIEQARYDYRHIELNVEAKGIQITLFEDSAAVTVPYWHSDSLVAESVMREIWGYIRIISRETGFFIYDSQLEKIIDLSSDFQSVLEAYCASVLAIRELFKT